tara:strand:- start:800 stop:976 length:177 start_codon:yes stop_codon:yes gene_type:complete
MIDELDVIGFDWSGVISNDMYPVYLTNMAILLKFDKPTVSIERWREISRSGAVEFLRQ